MVQPASKRLLTEAALFASGTRTIAGKALPVRGLASAKRALETGTKTTGIQILGDSTGNDPADWPYRLAQAIAPLYPAYTVHHRVWSDTTQDYAAPTVIQTGTAGVQSLNCLTTGLNGLTVPGKHPASGNLDIRLKLMLPDWTPATTGTISARSGGTGFHSWWLNITATGGMSFVFSTDGTALTTDSATALMGFTDGSTQWVRVVFIGNNAGSHNTKFYTSTDGATWTQLGTTVTGTAATLFDPGMGGAISGKMEFGARGTVVVPSRIYEGQIRDGEGGPTMAACLPGLWEPHPLSTADSAVEGAPILTFVNGSMPGAGLTYLNDSVRLPKMIPHYGQTACFTNESHNEGTSSGPDWLVTYRSWLTAITARRLMPITVVTQNPQATTAVNPSYQLARRLDLLGLVDERSVIDTFQAFLNYGNWQADLMADSVHPNAAGSDLWRDTVLAHFNAS